MIYLIVECNVKGTCFLRQLLKGECSMLISRDKRINDMLVGNISSGLYPSFAKFL